MGSASPHVPMTIGEHVKRRLFFLGGDLCVGEAHEMGVWIYSPFVMSLVRLRTLLNIVWIELA